MLSLLQATLISVRCTLLQMLGRQAAKQYSFKFLCKQINKILLKILLCKISALKLPFYRFFQSNLFFKHSQYFEIPTAICISNYTSGCSTVTNHLESGRSGTLTKERGKSGLLTEVYMTLARCSSASQTRAGVCSVCDREGVGASGGLPVTPFCKQTAA